MCATRLRLWLVASAVPLALGLVPAAARQAGAPPAAQAAAYAEVERTAQAEIAELHAPGAAIAIVKGDRIVYEKGVGVANVETGQTVSSDMLFRVGSVTKMFTAAALVGLADEGRLKLSDPIGKYASGLNRRLSRLTLHQLLSHTAGLRDDGPSYGAHDVSALAAGVRGWDENMFMTEPGRVMSYANPGFALAGYVLEQVARKPYDEVIAERVLKPLGMTRSSFQPTVVMTWPFAQGHAPGAGGAAPGVVRPFTDAASYWPAGFLFSNVAELARFAIAFMNDGVLDGRPALRSSTILTMSTGYADIPSSDTGAKYAYGLTTAMWRGARLVAHGGAIDGFGASVRMLPDQKAAVIILVNRSGAQLDKTAERALELVATLQAKVEAPSANIPMDAAEMVRYAGAYMNPPDRIELFVRDGALVLRRGTTETPVRKTGDLRFSAATAGAPPRPFALVPGPDGQIAFLHISSRALRRMPVKPQS